MTSHKGKSHPFYRAQGWISNRPCVDKPITWPHALELVDKIVVLEAGEQILALIQLINGIAYQQDRIKRDSIDVLAAGKAFAKTAYCAMALEEFASLDGSDPLNQRLLRHEWGKGGSRCGGDTGNE